MLTYPEFDPVIFSLPLGSFQFQLRWYSLMYVIGLVYAYIFFRRSSTSGRLKMSHAQIENIMLYIIVGMILGARLTYVLVYNLPHYLNNPSEIIAVWKGGLSFHGGFIGVCLGCLLFARKNGIPYFNIMDHAAAAVPLGLGMGRLGNFINSELWGRVTDAPVGMIFPNGGPLPRHPSQLYESFFEGFMIFLILNFLIRRRPKEGVISGLFVFLYAFFRFFIEFFREPDEQLGLVAGPFSMGQVLCVLMMIFGAGLIAWSMNRKDGRVIASGSSA